MKVWACGGLLAIGLGLAMGQEPPTARMDKAAHETGLTGRYDFKLTWMPNTLAEAAPDQAPGLFTAMREQLGLKLEPVKGPVDVLAVVKVRRPSGD